MRPHFQRHVRMKLSACAATVKLAANERKMIAVRALAGTEPVSTLAARHGVSRPFVYRQMHKASAALDELFSTEQTGRGSYPRYTKVSNGEARDNSAPFFIATPP
jgi:hypothetical protein